MMVFMEYGLGSRRSRRTPGCRPEGTAPPVRFPATTLWQLLTSLYPLGRIRQNLSARWTVRRTRRGQEGGGYDRRDGQDRRDGLESRRNSRPFFYPALPALRMTRDGRTRTCPSL